MIKEGKKRVTITLDEKILKPIENISKDFKASKSMLINKWLEYILDNFFKKYINKKGLKNDTEK